MTLRTLSHIFGLSTLGCLLTATNVSQAANQAPKLGVSKLPRAVENTAYEYQLQAKDADDRAVHFYLKSGPEGLSVDAAGLIRWQPSFRDAGDYSLVVNVTDGDLSTEKSLKLVVENTNRAPQVKTTALDNAFENQPFSASVEVEDVDYEPLTFSLKGAPKGMSIANETPSTGSISWLPTYAQAGSYEFVVLVDDGTAVVEQNLSINVENTNRAPYWQGRTAIAATENKLLNTQLEASDDDRDTLTYRLVSGPQGLSLSSTGELNWLPSFEQAGNHQLVLEVSDDESHYQQAIALSVAKTNRAPVWSQPSMTLPAIAENQKLFVQLQAADPDSEDVNKMSYRLDGQPEGMTINASGLIQWRPGFTDSGLQQFSVIASDGELETAMNITLPVENTNRPPRFISTPKTAAKEQSRYSYQPEVNDLDKQKLMLSLISGPANSRVEGNTFIFEPDYTQAGRHDVSLQVSDGDLTAEQSFSVWVANTNRPAEILNDPKEIHVLSENQAWQLAVNSQDVDGDAVTLSLSRYPVGVSINNGLVQWTPSFEQSGSHRIGVIAYDGSDVTESELVLTINNVNRLPRFVGQIPLNAKENQPYQYQLVAEDDDRQALTFSLLGGPEGMVLDGDTLKWTSGFFQAGEHEVKVAVNDSEESVELTQTISVENTNRAPSFTAPVVEVLEDQLYRYAINANDPDKEEVTVSVVDKPDMISFADNVLSWKTGFKDAGKYPVTLMATDGDLQTQQKFVINVVNVNRKPVVNSTPIINAHETIEYRYLVDVSDADDETMTLRFKQSPKGMKIKDRLITWTPRYDQNGVQVVELVINDGIDDTIHRFDIDVGNANREPVLEKVPVQTVTVGERWSYSLTASDPDGDELQYELSRAPEGMRLSKSGELSLRVSDEHIGKHTVIVYVKDGDLKFQQYFDMIVKPKQ